MFMNDAAFDDDSRGKSNRRGGSGGGSRGSREDDASDAVESLSFEDKRKPTGLSAHPNALKDDDDIEVLGDGDYLSGGSRSSVIQQQRDLQKKKLQERMNGGVVRTSLPKQYSAPRSLDIDDKPSRFGRDDDLDDGPPSRRGYSGRRGGHDDCDDDDDDRRAPPRRQGSSRDKDWDARTGSRDGDRGSGGRGGDRDRDRSDRGGRGDSDRDRDREGDRGRYRDRGDRSADRDQRSSRDRDRERDRGGWDDRDGVRGGGGGRSGGGRGGRDADDYGDRRSRDKEPEPVKPAKRSNGRGREDDDDIDRRGGRGGAKNPPARGRSRSRSRSCSRSRSRSASSQVSSDDERNDDNAATTYDPNSNKPRASANVPTAKKPKLDITDMRAFLMRPVPKAYDVVECYIERNKSGANKMFPEYCLYMKDGDRFLLTAKKRPQNRTSNYLISMQRGDLSRHGTENFLGKLRANFFGTEFAIYDNGSNPKHADQHTITSNPAGIRQELGTAMYAPNVLGQRGPRKMKVCVPRVREDGTRVVWRPLTKDDEMLNKCKEQDHTNLTYLINKPPRWNDQVCAFVLNFNGRVTMASVKNFQLVTPDDQETIVLQFGRVGKDLFTMDFRFPLCPLQAFAITLSSFDSKLACE